MSCRFNAIIVLLVLSVLALSACDGDIAGECPSAKAQRKAIRFCQKTPNCVITKDDVERASWTEELCRRYGTKEEIASMEAVATEVEK